MINKIIIGILIFLLLTASASAVYFWYAKNNAPTVSVVEYVPVPEIKEVIKIKRVEVPVEKIVTIEKEVLVDKLSLPDWISKDDNKQAIATAVIPPYEGSTNVIAIIDTKSGVGEIVAKREPVSFLGFANDTEIYGKLGYSTSREIQVSVGGRWLFARAGKIKIGVYGEGKAGFATNEAAGNLDATAGLVLTF